MRNFVLLATAVLVAIFMVPPAISVASATPAAPGLAQSPKLYVTVGVDQSGATRFLPAGVAGPGNPLVLSPAPPRRDAGRVPPRRFDGPAAREGDFHRRVLDRDHRDPCHASLEDHQLLHHQALEPALQGSQRAPEEGASVTELIRSDAPRRSAMAALALGGLIIGILWFSILTVIIALQDLSGISDSQTDSYMALFMGMVFLLLAFAIDIYRKEFMPDELIHKIRRPKIVLTRPFR